MEKFLLATVFIILGFITHAQSDASRFHVGIGPTVALPIGIFGHDYSFGVGGEGQGEYMLSEKFSAVINSGYTRFTGKIRFGSTAERYPSKGLIPILIGVRVYPATQFFIGARAGLSVLASERDGYGFFSYRPEIGYNGRSIQVALSFNSLIKNNYSSNYLGLTAIYVFGSKKE